MLLVSAAFVDKMRPLLEGKGEIKEISRAQRWTHRPGLKSLFSARVRQDKPARDAAMRRACLECGYTMAVNIISAAETRTSHLQTNRT